MPSHVIYEELWASKKLARCSLRAALAYPWIYLVSDEWGRFEYLPRVIWARVFGARTDVTPKAVIGWLAEYEREGLLVRYTAGGRDLCAWTRFRGRSPSRRRDSEFHEPPADLMAAVESERLTPKQPTETEGAPYQRPTPLRADHVLEHVQEHEHVPVRVPAAAPDVGPAPKRCPDCGQADTLIRLDRRADLAASWVCSRKAGGCGAGHALDRPEILSQMTPRARAATEARAAADRARLGGGGRQSRLQDYAPEAGPTGSELHAEAVALWIDGHGGAEACAQAADASGLPRVAWLAREGAPFGAVAWLDRYPRARHAGGGQTDGLRPVTPVDAATVEARAGRTCDHERLARMRPTTGKPRVCFVCQAEIRPLERVPA